MTDLFVEPTAWRAAGPAGLAEAGRRLAAADAGSMMVPVDHPDQVLLGVDGRTRRGGLRYATTAARQVCRRVGVGLAQLVMDLSGARPARAADPPAFYSPADAAYVFNVALARRFPLVEGAQLVVDVAAGVVDGVVGAGYRRLSNADLLEVVAGDAAGGVAFDEIAVSGRSAAVRFRAAAVLFDAGTADAPDPYHVGYYYANSEVGDGAVVACPYVWRAASRTAALAVRLGGRVKHHGKDFARRVARAVAAVADRVPPAGRLAEACRAMAAAGLGLGGRADADVRQVRRLVRAVAARGLSVGVARRVVRSALRQGAYDTSPFPDMRSAAASLWRGRTAYDLFVAAGREAAAMPTQARETVERVAYSMLAGKPVAVAAAD